MFPLTPSAHKDRVWLMRATDAIRLCRTGSFRALPRHQAELHLTAMALKSRPALRDFIDRTRLSSLPLCRVDESRLTELLRRLVAGGELVLAQECAEVVSSSASARQRRLIREIQAKFGQALSHEGRQYRLVADVDLGRMVGRDFYEVSSHKEAIQVLEVVSKRSDPSVAVLLEQARGLLSPDWRPPFAPDGLVLLRRPVAVVAPVRLADAITPSQMAKLMEPKVSFTPSLKVHGPVRLSATAKVEPPLRFEAGLQAEPAPPPVAAAG
jgi:antitoxin (DNA-binding transcriptional repressor) of toxin-antitoxin stability system